MQSWSIGILCFNEEGTLRQVYQQVVQLIDTWGLEDAEMIMVDDGSSDSTQDIIGELASIDPRIKPVFHPMNLGIGAGIRSIYFNAGKENVVFVPGDGQFDVMELAPYRDFDASVFIAFYREENLTYDAFRNLLSWFNKVFNRVFLGLELRDVNWVKVYKSHVLQGLGLRLKSSAIESEICAKLRISGVVPVEVKSNYLPRRAGVSKGASFKSIWLVLKELAKLFLAVNVFRIRKYNQ